MENNIDVPQAEGKDVTQYSQKVLTQEWTALKKEVDEMYELFDAQKELMPVAQEIANGWSTTRSVDYNKDNDEWTRAARIGTAVGTHSHRKCGVYLTLGTKDSLKDVLTYLGKMEERRDLIHVSTDKSKRQFDSHDIIYRLKDKPEGFVKLIVRIDIYHSSVCEYVEDGTQPKFKLVCK